MLLAVLMGGSDGLEEVIVLWGEQMRRKSLVLARH